MLPSPTVARTRTLATDRSRDLPRHVRRPPLATGVPVLLPTAAPSQGPQLGDVPAWCRRRARTPAVLG